MKLILFRFWFELLKNNKYLNWYRLLIWAHNAFKKRSILNLLTIVSDWRSCWSRIDWKANEKKERKKESQCNEWMDSENQKEWWKNSDDTSRRRFDCSWRTGSVRVRCSITAAQDQLNQRLHSQFCFILQLSIDAFPSINCSIATLSPLPDTWCQDAFSFHPSIFLAISSPIESRFRIIISYTYTLFWKSCKIRPCLPPF